MELPAFEIYIQEKLIGDISNTDQIHFSRTTTFLDVTPYPDTNYSMASSTIPKEIQLSYTVLKDCTYILPKSLFE